MGVTFHLPKCATPQATDVKQLNYIQWMLVAGIFITNYIQFLFFFMWEWNECKKTKPLVILSWVIALMFEIIEFAWFVVGGILFFSTIWIPECRQDDVIPWWGLLLFIGHLVVLLMMFGR